MKIELTKEEFEDNFNRLVAGLIERDDVSNFLVDKELKTVNIMVGDWSVTLNNDGTWEIN